MQFIYQKITDMILEKLAQGVVPWQKTWNTPYPKNFVSNIEYKGINILLLGMQNYESNYWLTFKQCKDLGGSIKKGERSTIVVFWKPIVRINNHALDESTADIHFLLRYYQVFNIDQCELPDEVKLKRATASNNLKLVSAEEIIANYRNPPDIETNNNIPSPRYLPRADKVEIQSINSFTNSENYYACLFHELIHSTGAKHRLSRRGIIGEISFGSENYSKEELIAEIGAGFLCNVAGIEKTIDNHAAYVNSWLSVLKNDNRMVIIAASQAQKATEHILNISITKSEEMLS